MFTQRIVYEVRPSFAMLSMFEFWSGEEWVSKPLEVFTAGVSTSAKTGNGNVTTTSVSTTDVGDQHVVAEVVVDMAGTNDKDMTSTEVIENVLEAEPIVH